MVSSGKLLVLLATPLSPLSIPGLGARRLYWLRGRLLAGVDWVEEMGLLLSKAWFLKDMLPPSILRLLKEEKLLEGITSDLSVLVSKIILYIMT